MDLQQLKEQIKRFTEEAKQLNGNKAIKKYKSAYELSKELKNSFTKQACLTNLSAAYIKHADQRKVESGLEYMQREISPENRSDDISYACIYFNMGLGYEKVNNYKDASFYFEKSLKECENLSVQQMALRKLVQVSKKESKPKSMVQWYKLLESTYKQSGTKMDHLQTMLDRISMKIRWEDLRQCCDCVDHLIKNPVDVQVPNFLEVLTQLAVLLFQSQNLKEAHHYLMVAKNLCEHDDQLQLEHAVVLQNLGVVCTYLSKWSDSENFLKAACKIHKCHLSSNTRPHIKPKLAKRCLSHCLANLALSLHLQNKLAEADAKRKEALNLAESEGDMDTFWQLQEANSKKPGTLATEHSDMALQNRDSSLSDLLVGSLSNQAQQEKAQKLSKEACINLTSLPKGLGYFQHRKHDKFAVVQDYCTISNVINSEEESDYSDTTSDEVNEETKGD